MTLAYQIRKRKEIITQRRNFLKVFSFLFIILSLSCRENQSDFSFFLSSFLSLLAGQRNENLSIKKMFFSPPFSRIEINRSNGENYHLPCYSFSAGIYRRGVNLRKSKTNRYLFVTKCFAITNWLKPGGGALKAAFIGINLHDLIDDSDSAWMSSRKKGGDVWLGSNWNVEMVLRI